MTVLGGHRFDSDSNGTACCELVLTIGIELTPAEAVVMDDRVGRSSLRFRFERNRVLRIGAHNRNRTDDLFLTKEVLYRLSYVSVLRTACCGTATAWSG